MSNYKWIDNENVVHTIECYSVVQKNEICTQMDRLGEDNIKQNNPISGRENLRIHLYMFILAYNKAELF